MAWIESHQELARHPKAKKLARLLGVSLPAAIGHLHFFWWWAMDYAQDGDISKYDPEDIADASGWEGSPDIWFKALLESEFIDSDKRIHDWFDYAGRLVERREQNKERKRRSRTKKTHSDGGHVDVTRDGSVTGSSVTGLPNQTQPNQPNHTEPYPTQPHQTNEMGGVVVEPINPYRVFEQEGFGTISPVIKDQIDDLVKTYGDRWYLEAMKTSVMAGKRSLSYVNGILKRWITSGIDDPWKEDRRSEKSQGGVEGIRPGSDPAKSKFASADKNKPFDPRELEELGLR